MYLDDVIRVPAALKRIITVLAHKFSININEFISVVPCQLLQSNISILHYITLCFCKLKRNLWLPYNQYFMDYDAVRISVPRLLLSLSLTNPFDIEVIVSYFNFVCLIL
jgi:hypothetical protein